MWASSLDGSVLPKPAAGVWVRPLSGYRPAAPQRTVVALCAAASQHAWRLAALQDCGGVLLTASQLGWEGAASPGKDSFLRSSISVPGSETGRSCARLGDMVQSYAIGLKHTSCAHVLRLAGIRIVVLAKLLRTARGDPGDAVFRTQRKRR